MQFGAEERLSEAIGESGGDRSRSLGIAAKPGEGDIGDDLSCISPKLDLTVTDLLDSDWYDEYSDP